MKKDRAVTDGLFKKNLVLSSGILTSLCAVACSKALIAVELSISLFFITLISSVLTTIFLQNKNYYIQMFVCSVLSSICYIPVYMLIENISPSYISEMGIYLPLIVVQSVLIYRTQRNYFEENTIFSSAARLTVFIAGSSVFMILLAIIREILAYGTIFGMAVVSEKIFESASQPWFAMIVIGFSAAAVRCRILKRSKDGER